MAKTLIYVSGSPTSVKLGDTDTNLYLQVAKDNAAVDLTAVTSITVKIADANKNYLKDISITPASLTSGNNGILTVPLNSDNVGGLNSGDYYFEVWIVTADSETEIYPDMNVTKFHVFNNLVGGTTILTTLTMQAFLDRITSTQTASETSLSNSETALANANTANASAAKTLSNLNAGNYLTKDTLSNAPSFEVLQTQVKTALLEEHTTSVEVQDARTNSSSKTYQTLKERMDNQENDLNNTINDKLSQISSAPEAFANLAALQSTYPTGKTGIFVTADNGHKYIWANGSWTDAGVYQSAGFAYPVGLKSLVGFAYPATPGGMPIVTNNSNITITIPNKIFAIVLSSDTNTNQKLLTISSPGDVILAPGEFLYVDIPNLIISHGTYDALSTLNYDYLIIGYNSYGSLTGPWANYQIEQITQVNTSLASWAYPIASETVSISNVSDSILSVKLPSAVMMATDYQRLNSTKVTSMVSKLILSNGNGTVTLNNNSVLILDIDKQTIDCYNIAALDQVSDHYILLALNHYGYLKGPWSIYQPSDKLVNNSNYLPQYYFDNNYIDNKIKTIRQNSLVATGTNFAYFTDSHWADNAGNQGKLLNYITQNTSVETTIFGGDIPRAYGTQADVEADGQTYLTLSRSLKHPVYGVHGNHDMTIKTDASTNTGYTAPQIDQYDILNRGNELIQHGVQNKNYYYLDNPIQKVRYIIIDDWEGLDTSTYWGVKAGITQQQLDWLLTTAFNADGYTFIVLTHAPSDSKLTSYITTNDVIQQLLVAINNKGQFNYNNNGIKGSADFTATTNHIAIHLCGHNHCDESNVEDNVLSVSTMCDALYNNDPNYTTVRTARTINEQCIDVISVDTTARTIKMVRIGAGNGDRNFNY